MPLRYIKATFYPRHKVENSRGEAQWEPDWESPQNIRVGVSTDRVNRAEVKGNVQIEVYNARLPAGLEGLGPGAIVKWDDSFWDVASPEMIRTGPTRAVRHLTTQIRRRPDLQGGGR